MKIQIKKCIYVGLLLAVLLLLAGCGAQISTKLCLDEDFAGERIMTCVAAKSDISEYFEGGIEGIDQVISECCPEELAWEKSEDDSSLTYTFTLSFQSYEDYKAKVESILGRESEMEFRQPDSVFSSGLALQEDFDSRDLLGWFRAEVEENNSVSDISNLWELSGTTVLYGEEEFSTGGAIQFDRIVSNPVSAIHMDTVCSQGKVERTIVFDLPAAARDAKQEQVDAYMDGLVPTGGSGIWNTVSDGYQYTISFSADSFENLTEGMTKIFGGDAQLYTETNENDPFTKTQTYAEYFNVYAFGNASDGALRFDSSYSFDSNENRYIESYDDYGTSEGTHYVWETYTGDVEINFQVVDKAVAESLNCGISLNSQDTFDAVLDINFPAGQNEEAQRTANYYQTQWSDITVETLSEGVETCRITLQDSQCPVSERLGEILGTDYADLSVTMDKGLFKTSCEIVNSLDFTYLADRAGIFDSNANYTLDVGPYKLKAMEVNGYLDSDAKSPYFLEGVNGVYLTATADKMNLGGILVILSLVAVVVAAVFIGFRAFVKRMAERDGREEEPFGKLAGVYFTAAVALVAGKLRNLFSGLLHGAGLVAGRYYPEGANRRLIDYFYGSRWPALILLGGLIVLPVTWFILSRILMWIFYGLLSLHGTYGVLAAISSLMALIQVLSIPVALIWMIADKVRSKPDVEAEYDRAFQDDLERFKQTRGLEQLCLAPEQVALVEPLKLVGPDYDVEDLPLTFWPALLRWIVRIFTYHSRLILKYGSDGKVRYSCAAQNIWYFSENQLYRYEVKYDICTGVIRAESTCETFYQDLTTVCSQEKTIKVWQSLFKQIPRIYQSFLVTTESGNSIHAAVDNELVPAESMTIAIHAMQNLARDQKAVCENKKNSRRSYI